MTNAPARLLAEFVGTFALIFIGAGAIMTASELTGGGYSLIGIAAAHGFVRETNATAADGDHFTPYTFAREVFLRRDVLHRDAAPVAVEFFGDQLGEIGRAHV